MNITRPVLRYPGGKYKMTSWIILHFPPHGLYCEPFGGAASVLMAKPRAQGEIYNDLDGEIVNVFRVLRNSSTANELERLCRLTPFAYEEYKDAYLPCEDPVERARRVIFRSFASIGSDGVSRRNSGFRGLKNNETSVTAAQEWSRYPDVIRSFVERLQNVLIEHRDAFRMFDLYDRMDSLFYVDPPYVMSSRSSSTVMYKNELDDGDHAKLAERLHSLQGKVVLSGYSTPLYDELYQGWRKISKKSTAQNGKGRVECLWLSPNIQPNFFEAIQ